VKLLKGGICSPRNKTGVGYFHVPSITSTTMPRMPSGKSRHDPLIVQLNDDQLREKYGRLSQPGLRKKSRKASEDEEHGDVRSIPKGMNGK
jgi:hypothetical protein